MSKRLKKAVAKPVSREKWFEYYVRRFNRDPNLKAAEHMALWMYLLMLADVEIAG